MTTIKKHGAYFMASFTVLACSTVTAVALALGDYAMAAVALCALVALLYVGVAFAALHEGLDSGVLAFIPALSLRLRGWKIAILLSGALVMAGACSLASVAYGFGAGEYAGNQILAAFVESGENPDRALPARELEDSLAGIDDEEGGLA